MGDNKKRPYGCIEKELSNCDADTKKQLKDSYGDTENKLKNSDGCIENDENESPSIPAKKKPKLIKIEFTDAAFEILKESAKLFPTVKAKSEDKWRNTLNLSTKNYIIHAFNNLAQKSNEHFKQFGETWQVKLNALITNKMEDMKNKQISILHSIQADPNLEAISHILLDHLKTAYEEETSSLKQLLNGPHSINNFFEEIIKIEDCFDEIYTQNLREDQNKWKTMISSSKIVNFPQKNTAVSKFNSISELKFAMDTYAPTFQKLIDEFLQLLAKKKIKVMNEPKSSLKDVKRTFYKVYYVYNGNTNAITDCVRASFVFESFMDIYCALKIFDEDVIQNLYKQEIIRIKDRFYQDKVQFGYRDLMFNIYCPETNLICEIQFHLHQFYKMKNRSHEVYKIGRYFEKDGKNLIYDMTREYRSDSFNTITQQHNKI